MTLRVRLALLNIFTVAGILLVLGTVVYFTVNISLVNEIDIILRREVELIIREVRAGRVGGLVEVNLPGVEQEVDIYYQFLNSDRQIVSSSANLVGFQGPLDEKGLDATQPVFRNLMVGGSSWRVLTVPLSILGGQGRIIGYIQAGMNQTIKQKTLDVLLTILIIGCLIVMGIAGFVSWLGTRQALQPLQAGTRVALQITRADDLSRRIPYRGNPTDEVGQLITAFNATLSRLENLFTSQRRFLADVGHELRTPLTVIKGNVGLMRRMNSLDGEALSSIENEVERLTRLVGDLLLLAQAESGKLPLARRTVELDTVMLAVMQQMRILAHEKLSLKLGDIDQVIVCGDEDRLKQVLVNLIGNAIQYTPTGGEVLVGLSKNENWACLTVSDSGPGISPEDAPHIFERFFRGEKSRTRGKGSMEGKGFGLGLSIAYWIVRNHGGIIEVAPRLPHGTVFTVWLPLAQGACEDEAGSKLVP